MVGGVTIQEIKWTGRLPHVSGLPYLPGVFYLHVNRSLDYSYCSSDFGLLIWRKEGHLLTRATLGEQTFCTFRYKTWQTVLSWLSEKFSMVRSPSWPGQLFSI